MKKVLALLVVGAMLSLGGAAFADEPNESEETVKSEEVTVTENTVDTGNEEATEAVSAEDTEEEEVSGEDKDDEGETAESEEAQETSKDKGKKSKRIREVLPDKNEKSKHKYDYSEDNDEKSKDKGDKKYGDEKDGKRSVLGNGITKDTLKAKKEEFKSLHKEIKEYIKEVKALFKDSDSDARKEILAEIAAAKKELLDNTIGAFIKGFEVDFEEYDGVKPEIINGRTLVPVRAILEKYDATLSWDDETKTVTITKGDVVVTMKIDSLAATVNGEEVSIEVPPTIKKNRTIVPIRFLSEQFDMDVEWDEDSRMIIIEEKE